MSRSPRSVVVFLLALLIGSAVPAALYARPAKKGFVKASVGREILSKPDGAEATNREAATVLLEGLDGAVLELYEDIALIEINRADLSELQNRARRLAVLLDVGDDFDKVFLNGTTVDVRETSSDPPVGTPDEPYRGDQQGTWIVQFIGPIRTEWLDAVQKLGVRPVQYIPSHAYIVAARESQIKAAENIAAVQWTSQLHRYFKPSITFTEPPTIMALEEPTVELWIELAQTEETSDALVEIEALCLSGFETALVSENEVRVEGVFSTSDVPTILAEPLVFGLADRPALDLSDERAALGVTSIVPSVGLPSPDAGKYKKWLSDVCPTCTNLQADGFYVGIADTGLDGGDRIASGTISGEPSSSDLHRTELPKSKIRWGSSFSPTTLASGQTWSNCSSACPDTTASRHDTYGHGTLVAGMAAADPWVGGEQDAGGFFLGFGVAPSAGLLITKVNPRSIVSTALAVRIAANDARSHATPSYWQNYSMNQYDAAPLSTDCSQFYDGAYTILSRDFDLAVRDTNAGVAGNQQITITVSSGNISQQQKRSQCPGVDRLLTLPPATAKNVIAMGGGENVRPDSWMCQGALAEDYQNLAMNAKHGTALAGWYKPDLIAVSTNISSLVTNDAPSGGSFCSSTIAEPSLPTGYRASTGTSFAAPIGAAAAALASRRFSSNPAAASPALVKAMLIAGAKSMRGGKDRAGLRTWTVGATYFVGDRVLPHMLNGRYYEVESVGSAGRGTARNPEPLWPTNGGSVADGFGTTSLIWRDKGVEPGDMEIAAFPNAQQGFGRLVLDDVLSEYPARVFVNETQSLSSGGAWSGDYVVHDLSRPVRIALVWTDPPAMWSGSGQTSAVPPLVNDLDLSVRINQSGNCIGRYVGNDVNTTDESRYYPDCTAGVRDVKNNAEIVRFFADPARGDTAFTVKVAFAAGSSAQNYALVVWNAYSAGTTIPPPPAPSSFSATGTSSSQVSLAWAASPGATSYELQRSLGLHDPYVTVATPVSTSYVDGRRSPATSYLYRLRAKNGTGVSEWMIDPGTTVAMTDPVLTPSHTNVRAVHVTELRQAIGAIRSTAELAPFGWTDDPLVAGTTIVKASHLSELRTALTEAREALGLATLTFTDGTIIPGATVIRAVHIQQLRDGL
jgi:hypothetical protein